MNGISFCVFQVLALLLFTAPALAADAVGAVRELAGGATVTRAADKVSATLKSGDSVFEADVIETAADGRVVIKFTDDAELVISGKGRLALEKYIYDSKKQEEASASFGIFGMAFSYVGGLMEKRQGANVTLNFDYGSIGIRGTTVYGAMKNGVNWVYLEQGKALVRNEGGEAALVAGFGTSVVSKDEMPRPPYLWGPDQIEWIKRAVADPATLATPAMAFYRNETAKEGKELKKSESAESVRQRVAEAPSGAGAPAARGGSRPAEAPARAAPASPPQPAASAEPVPAQEPAQDIFAAGSLAPGKLGVKILPDENGAVRIETKWPVTINLAEVDISARKLEKGVLWYEAEMKSSGISGMAYLEMWVHFPGEKGGYYFSRGLDNVLTQAQDWETFRTPFFLKDAPVPDKVVLNVVIKGSGSVAVRGVKLQAAR